MNILAEIVNRKGDFWNGRGPRHDTVISTRVRLSRNVPGIPFPHCGTKENMDRIMELLDSWIKNGKYNGRLRVLEIPEFSIQDRRFLRERNLLTSEMENSDISATVIDSCNEFSVLLNDEDHLKIQVIKPGLQLNEAWDLANAVDSDINRHMSYAFSDKYGYLMADPSRNGTGMRISVILHLPVLTENQRMSEYLPSIKDSGFSLSGTLGSGKMITGGLYILKNMETHGFSEIDLLDRADSIITNLIKLEDDARDMWLDEASMEFEDRVMRSLGILRYSRKLTYGEAIEHLSKIRLGVVMSLIKEYSLDVINDLMVNVQWSHLQLQTGKTFSSVMESDNYRSEFVREILSRAEVKNV